VAWLLLALTLLISGIYLATSQTAPPAIDLAFSLVEAFSASTVGALILRRRPGHGIGWICLAAGSLGSLAVVGRVVANLFARPGALLDPLPSIGLLLMSICPTFAIVLIGPVLLAAYPSGRISRTGKRVALVIGSLAGPLLLLTWMAPPVLQVGEVVGHNPVWVPLLPAAMADQAGALVFIGYLAALVLASVSLGLRYRRSDPIERLQIRWVAANAVASIVVILVLTTNLFGLGDAVWSLWLLVAAFVPVSVGIAILRYHLYDIDRIISRTIGYGVVSVVLFAVFGAVNLALVSSVSPLVRDEGIAVAASTLLVAALFNPLRGRVQRAVDRRFHRAHYDAERMVADFASRLRDDLDLATLASELASTTTRAVQPTTAGLWLRRRGTP
jgi:hypothetical protein